MADMVVVGGGVIGVISALNLARTGARVILLEQSALGRESSWAGGGIVSPLYPWRYGDAVTALSTWSQGAYGQLALELRAETGVDPEVSVTGLYWLDLEDEADALSWSADNGLSLCSISVSQVKNNVPALAESYGRAICMQDAANVRNPRLVRALRAALAKRSNVDLRENSPVCEILNRNGRVVGVRTDAEEIYAERVVLAAGAWSGELLAKLGQHLPVEPVKGQMVLYKCEPAYLSAMVLAEGRYAIPRRDGHVLVGSTLEHVGFDKIPTGEALASLTASAEKMLPGLAQREVVGHWAGLRPGSPDGIPFIGEVPELPGLWLNCGHYRNGLVLAPASCELLKNLMLGETPIVDPAPYSPAGRLGAL